MLTSSPQGVHMLKNMLQLLKRDKRGISNVIVVMLSLVLVVIIVSNIVLWSYQMNQFDWERIQEKIEITNMTSTNALSWAAAQSEFTIRNGTRVSGAYTDTFTINDQYETFTEVFTQQGWLSGWNKRARITISHTSIDSTLTNFPLLIYLSNSSGLGSSNFTFVFNELQTKDARKKIAIATGDGTTQCYAEIEKWDDTNRRAWLWVNVPTLSASQDNSFYLYYDMTHADNTAYVGDPGSVAAQNVWNNNYKLVMHLQEASGTQNDSTSNINTGTPQGGVGQNATGFIDGADHLDGADDRVQVSDSSSLSFTNNALTMEAWIKFDTLPAREAVIARKDNQWQLGFADSGTIRNRVSTNGINGWTGANDEAYQFQTGIWYYSTFVYDGSTIVNKINGEQVGLAHTVTGNINDNSNPLYLGYRASPNTYINGVVDEVRISNTSRNTAWVRATYKTQRDTLATYGTEETTQQRYNLDIIGTFNTNLPTYPAAYVQKVEIQLRYRASDSGENWYLKAYNWSSGNYSDNGFNYTGGSTPSTSWDMYALDLSTCWQSYADQNGTIVIEFVNAQPDLNQTSIDIDFLAVKIVVIDTEFTIHNTGSLTTHLISLWVTNSSSHQRYDLNTFINPGDTFIIVRNDVSLPSPPYIIKVVTEKGNMAVYTGQ